MTMLGIDGRKHVAPDSVPTPPSPYYYYFTADGTIASLSPGTPTPAAGTECKMDSTRAITAFLSGVASVSNADGTLTISPTTGAVVASRAAIGGVITVAAGSNTSTHTSSTGSGATVLATGPTLSAPLLGTPASGVLTNCSGLPVSSGIAGLGTGIATSLAVNVGTAGAPVVNGGVLGTPSSGTLTNCTGLPVAGLASVAANTVIANATAGAASPTAVALAASQFLARASAGNIAAQSITTAGLAFVAAADSAAETALLDNATFALKGLLTAAEKIELNALDGRNSSGTVKRIFRPGDYMVGNVYDPTGVSTSTAFDAMMTAIIAFNDRCAIELPPGVFRITTGTLSGWGNGSISIRGPGRGNCVLIPTATGNFITLPSGLTGSDSFTISGFSIYNTTGTPFTTGAGININGCDNVLIEELAFIDLFYDVHVNGSAIKVQMDKMVSYHTNGTATSVGVLINNGLAGDTYIKDYVVSNTGATRRRAAIEILESGHYEITLCNLTGTAKGILIDPAAAQIVAFGFHTNVLCDSNSVNGMDLNATTATSTIKNIKSVNSWYSGTIAGGGAGCRTQGTGAGIINGITFTTDRFLNNQTHGMQHEFGTDVRFSDCDMKGNNAAGTAAPTPPAVGNSGLFVGAAVSNWSINGGKYGGSDTVVGPSGVNQDWGIFVTAGAGNNIKISPDDLTGNRTGPIMMGATGVSCFVNGCPGLAAPYVRSASSASITTVITVANIFIPKNSQRASTTYRLWARGQHSGAATAPTFTCRYGSATDAVGAAATNPIIVSALDVTAATSQQFSVEFYLTVTAIGTGTAGNIQGAGVGINSTAATGAARAYGTALIARSNTVGFLGMATDADRYLTLAFVCGVAGATIHNAGIEILSY